MAARNKTMGIAEGEAESLAADVLSVPTQGLALGRETIRDCLFQGDSLVLMKSMPDACVDLVVADPPYSIAKDFGMHKAKSMSSREYQDWLETWVPDCVRIMKPGASLYLCGDWRSSGAIERVLEPLLVLRNRITWEREKGRAARGNWKNASEDIWYASKGEPALFEADRVRLRRSVVAPYRQDGKPKDWVDGDQPYRDTAPSNLWTDCTVPFWSMAENTPHPTQKPEKLLAKLILASSREGDLVFDPFAGSGTTGVVARKLGRSYCMVELDPDYCLLGAKRLRLALEDRRIQGYEDGVFLDRNFKGSLKVQAK